MAKNSHVASARNVVLHPDELHYIAKNYMEIKNYSRALQYYKELFAVLLGDPKFHFEIVRTYAALDDKESAIQEARRAVELDPFNYAENYFMNSIGNL